MPEPRTNKYTTNINELKPEGNTTYTIKPNNLQNQKHTNTTKNTDIQTKKQNGGTQYKHTET